MWFSKTLESLKEDDVDKTIYINEASRIKYLSNLAAQRITSYHVGRLFTWVARHRMEKPGYSTAPKQLV